MRPAVANDGGDITFRGFKEGIVYLDMKGSCAGCPSSTATLKHGIQNLLEHFVPDVVEVQQTTRSEFATDRTSPITLWIVPRRALGRKSARRGAMIAAC